jgi:hypothetical protein
VHALGTYGARGLGRHRTGRLAQDLREVDGLDDLPGDAREVEPTQCRLDVDPRHDLVRVHPRHDRAQVDPRHRSVEVRPVDDRVQVEPGGDGVEVDPAHHGVEVEAGGDGVEVDPAHHGVEVDPGHRGIEVDPGDDGVDVQERGQFVEVDVGTDHVRHVDGRQRPVHRQGEGPPDHLDRGPLEPLPNGQAAVGQPSGQPGVRPVARYPRTQPHDTDGRRHERPRRGDREGRGGHAGPQRDVEGIPDGRVHDRSAPAPVDVHGASLQPAHRSGLIPGG